MIKVQRIPYKGTARKYIAEHNNNTYICYLDEFNCCCPLIVNEKTKEDITNTLLGTKIQSACYNCK
jgi:hypothetical protein